MYRLLEATGREKGGLNFAPTQADLAIVSPVPHNNQSNDVSNYTQTFEYDKLGNILNMSSQNKWSRNYFYDTATNQLQKHDEFGQNEYTYDAHGNMLSIPGISEMVWDFGDKLNKTISGTVISYYNYDSGGERTRKVVLKQGGIREERYYINGYEVYRKFISDVIDTERQTLHIADDSKRFAIIDTLNIENGISLGTTDVTIRYQYDNHLGSASLELDEFANIISYEEYHPFGTSSYRLGTNEAEVQLKRYRYVGKERDEETGLYYFGARYYAGWMGRWISVDPLKEKYLNLTPYNYCAGNPVKFVDTDGEKIVNAAKEGTKERKIIDNAIKTIQRTDPELYNRLNSMSECIIVSMQELNPQDFYATDAKLPDRIEYGLAEYDFITEQGMSITNITYDEKGQPLNAKVSRQMTYEERTEITDKLWNEAGGNTEVFYKLLKDVSFNKEITNEEAKELINLRIDENNVIAAIYLDPLNKTDRKFAETLAHELGHVEFAIFNTVEAWIWKGDNLGNPLTPEGKGHDPNNPSGKAAEKAEKTTKLNY